MSTLASVNLLDAHSLLAHFGAVGVFVALVLETGLLIGIVLPGDSLLFTAGILCATSTRSALHLSLPAVLVSAVAGALVGAQIGYLIGRSAGHVAARRPRLAGVVDRAAAVLDRYGPAKAIVLARFVPGVRTVLNPLAGAVGVPARVFTMWQVIGGVLWSAGVTLAGWALGKRIPNIDHYLLPIVAVVVVLSLLPIALEILRSRRHRDGSTSGHHQR
jgi:membrane-associated protein